MRKLLTNEGGLTLIEVVATVVITAILSGVIYSVFTTGIKLYQKIGIEGQLRDDADYVATIILNEMYNSPPNVVSEYENPETGAQGIEMIRYKPKNVDGFLVEDSTEIEDHTLIYKEDQTFYIEKLNAQNTSISKKKIDTANAINTETQDGTNSETSFISLGSCTMEDSTHKCEHGRISLNLVLQDRNSENNSFINTKPLILKSSFGF
ncbi:prepilin-type N-terminal cleavage/methylation domain-containing protein [Bacillus sp. BRMEA1]|uniref:pilus assembly FimT family protein n=1 Tax=Neobacillus endophyticus TaxID=2738405 RepID=UPI001565199D|nr:prepilin-type N-terminal cleavage/methylation domain-containing protein [Neobacillus endophyticus]NRD76010.1 prepilin-type N-terminal cleavage/methylation domain-containing protein [Neobacillus endophyticus]